MPTNYAGSDVSYPANIPLPNDGEPAAAAFLNPAWQKLADRTAHIAARLAPLASLAALTAIAAPSNGMVRHVVGFGLFTFQTSATSGQSPFRLAADDATTGGWVAGVARQTTIWAPGTSIVGVSSAARAVSLDGSFNLLTSTEAIYGGTSALKTTNVLTSTHATNTFHLLMPLNEYMVHGKTLATATLYFTPGDEIVGTPTGRVRLGIGRQVQTVDGFAIPDPPTALLSTGSGFAVDAAGGTYPLTLHTLVFTPDQNAAIDTTQYGYSAVIPLSFDTDGDFTYCIHGIKLAFT